MNVANLELCRQLHELSGWFEHHIDPNTGEVTNRREVIQPGTGGNPLPEYSLGYLIRKLPRETNLRKRKHDDDFEAWYGRFDKTPDIDGDPIELRADTPEDAAAQLAIELFKQGILTRGEASNE